MAYNVKVLADSVSIHGKRLTTLQLTYPRIIHCELLTHRMFSRNAASSRAIPTEKLIEKVCTTPFIPESFDQNQPGMQAGAPLSSYDQLAARTAWLDARDFAVHQARRMLVLGVHKQIVNRLLEPFQWYTVIVSATEWSNFFGLRCHPDAQPQIRAIAELMRDAMAASTPMLLAPDEWHLPLLPDREALLIEGYTLDDIKKISVGRCARVSYLTHDGVRDPRKDVELCDRLVASGHMSPLEHVATPAHSFFGNFKGWLQLRSFIPHQDDFGRRPKVE